jgi:hypothetical protein
MRERVRIELLNSDVTLMATHLEAPALLVDLVFQRPSFSLDHHV